MSEYKRAQDGVVGRYKTPSSCCALVAVRIALVPLTDTEVARGHSVVRIRCSSFCGAKDFS